MYVDTRPLSKILTSVPPVGVRTGARILIEVDDGTFRTASRAYYDKKTARSSTTTPRPARPLPRLANILSTMFRNDTFHEPQPPTTVT